MRCETAVAMVSAPEDASRIAIDFIEERSKVFRAWQRRIGSPFQISKLTVEAPLLGCIDIAELRDVFILPFAWMSKGRPRLKEHDVVCTNAVAEAELISNMRRHTCFAKAAQSTINLRALNLSERHAID